MRPPQRHQGDHPCQQQQHHHKWPRLQRFPFCPESFPSIHRHHSKPPLKSNTKILMVNGSHHIRSMGISIYPKELSTLSCYESSRVIMPCNLISLWTE